MTMPLRPGAVTVLFCSNVFVEVEKPMRRTASW